MPQVSWKKIFLVFVLFWFFLPLLLPDNYSGLEGEEKTVAKFAIDEARTELVLIWRYGSSIEEINIADEQLPRGVGPAEKAWKVDLLGYTYFHIPLEKGEIMVVKDPNGYHAITGSYREYFPGADLVLWTGMLILYATPVFLLYYLIKSRLKRRQNRK